MRIKAIVSSVIGLIVGLSIGCDGSSEEYGTVREAAIAIGEAACKHAGECQGNTNPAQLEMCIEGTTLTLCANKDCNLPLSVTDAAINSCIRAWEDFSCDDGGTPSQCNDLP